MVVSLNGQTLDVETDDAAVGALVRERLHWVQGEWFLRPRDGVPYRTLFGGANREEDMMLELLIHTRSVTGVREARSLGYGWDGRNFTATIEVETATGTFTTGFTT